MRGSYRTRSIGQQETNMSLDRCQASRTNQRLDALAGSRESPYFRFESSNKEDKT